MALFQSADSQQPFVNSDHFADQTEPYRYELRVHCYRMLGSLHDAEDLLQETYLRAWKKYTQTPQMDGFRPWLYKIATNACLDVLRQRKRRALIQPDAPMADGIPERVAVEEDIWLEPFPSALIPDLPSNPEAIYGVRESVSLAFLTVLHKLSPQQRAILILRDVLGWKTREVAAFLEMSEPAVNSATLRGRKRLLGTKSRRSVEPMVVQTFLDGYVAAWESKDMVGLVGLLKQDVVMSMPPLPIWFGGLDRVAGFVGHVPFNPLGGGWRARVVGVNGQAGVALYGTRPGSSPVFFGVHALTIEPEGIARIDHFMAGDAPFLEKPIVGKWVRFFDLV